jgi:hypothetical protein
VRYMAARLLPLVVSALGFSAGFAPAPVGAAEVVSYDARVRVTGQLVVSFHGDPAGCAAFFRCDVQGGSIRWTPQSQARLSLIRLPGGRLDGDLASSGIGTRPDTVAVVQRSASDGTHICADARGSLFESFGLVAVGVQRLTFGLGARPGVFGPPGSVLRPTNCGGPLPEEALRGLSTRVVSLRALRSRPTQVDLSSSASFETEGLAGTVESTIVLRVGRWQVRRHPVRRAPPRRFSSRPPVREIAVEYRVARLTGSLPVSVRGDPRTCAPLDACGLAGTLTVQPGPARGEGYVFGYGRVPFAALRRTVGLAPGPAPRRTSARGYISWGRGRGSVSVLLTRNGTPACRDAVRLRSGFLDLRVRGRRVTALFARGLPYGDGADLLRTRCPGPLLADLAQGTRLAFGRLPRRTLGRRRFTIHLNRGAHGVTPGYSLRSRPDLRIVLEREAVERGVLSVDSGGVLEVDVGGGGGGGGGGL